MRQYADILAYDKYGQLALIAEVKSKRGTSSDWAAKMRRNMYAHGLLPNAPYFLLALPDRFYLWKNNGETVEELQPTHQVDPTAFLQPYYEKSGISPDVITEDSFELIVASWLRQVTWATNLEDLQNESKDFLVNTGLFDKLAGGNLELAVAA